MESNDRQRRIDELFAEAIAHPDSAQQAYLDSACASDPAEIRAEVERLLMMDQRMQQQGDFLAHSPFKDVAAEMQQATNAAHKEEDAAAAKPNFNPRSSQADRNLLFGIVALQFDFITRDQLITAMNTWVLAKHRSLGELLVEQMAIKAADHVMLEAMVERHVQMHEDDAEKSLASLSSIGSIRDNLESILDPDIERSVASISSQRIDDPEATANWSLGASTSKGSRFRVLRPHAKGGLGEVFVALDTELNREVALKQIQAWLADDPESRGRFTLEAEVTGGLEHPGIVPVYGLGHDGKGCPFYAMRFIKGHSLREAIAHFHAASNITRDPAQRALEFRNLLERFIDVCNAIAYAHSRGILHRDLKPGNIMLGDFGETLVVDWGLAKVVGRSDSVIRSEDGTLRPPAHKDSAPTRVGQAMGTLPYMSPEQAAGRLEQLGPASDVYSLGATLYAILTGQAPFDSQDSQIIDKVAKGQFPLPRQLKSDVARPLEAICLKALANQSTDRHSSPQALADDIKRWLADEPVTCYREAGLARIRRWFRRHSRAAGAIAASALMTIAMLLIIVTLTARYSARLAKARDNESASRRRAEASESGARLNLAYSHLNAGNLERAQTLLDTIAWDQRGWDFRHVQHAVRFAVVSAKAQQEQHQPLPTSPSSVLADTADAVSAVAVARDGTAYIGCVNGNVVVSATGQNPSATPNRRVDDCISALTTSDESGCVAVGTTGGRVLVFSHDLATIHSEFDAHCPVVEIVFVLQGKGVAVSTCEKTIRIWDVHSGKCLFECQRLIATAPLTRRSLTPNSDGSILAAIAIDDQSRNAVYFWDSTTGALLGKVNVVTQLNGGITFACHDQLLLLASRDGTIYPYSLDASSPAQLQEWFSSNGTGEDRVSDEELEAEYVLSKLKKDGNAPRGTFRTIKSVTIDPSHVDCLLGPPALMTRFAVHPNENRFVTLGTDGALQFWDLDARVPTLTVLADSSPAFAQLQFSRDGRSLHCVSSGQLKELTQGPYADDRPFRICVRKTDDFHNILTLLLPDEPTKLRLNSTILAVGFASGKVKAWNLATSQLECETDCTTTFSEGKHPVPIFGIDASGSSMVVINSSGQVELWNVRDGTKRWVPLESGVLGASAVDAAVSETLSLVAVLQENVFAHDNSALLLAPLPGEGARSVLSVDNDWKPTHVSFVSGHTVALWSNRHLMSYGLDCNAQLPENKTDIPGQPGSVVEVSANGTLTTVSPMQINTYTLQQSTLRELHSITGPHTICDDVSVGSFSEFLYVLRYRHSAAGRSTITAFRDTDILLGFIDDWGQFGSQAAVLCNLSKGTQLYNMKVVGEADICLAACGGLFAVVDRGLPLEAQSFMGAGELSREFTVRTWYAPQSCPTKALRGHVEEVTALAHSPDDSVLISGGSDGGTIVWNLRSGTAKNGFAVPCAVAAFADPNRAILQDTFGHAIVAEGLASAGLVRFWEVGTSRRNANFALPRTYLGSGSFASNSIIIDSDHDRVIYITRERDESEKGTTRRVLVCREYLGTREVWKVKSENGAWVAVTGNATCVYLLNSDDELVRIVSTETGREIGVINTLDSDALPALLRERLAYFEPRDGRLRLHISDLGVSRDGGFLFLLVEFFSVRRQGCGILVWNVDEGRIEKFLNDTRDAAQERAFDESHMSVSPDGRYVAVANRANSRVTIWECPAGKVFQTRVFETKGGGVTSLSFNWGSTSLAIGFSTGELEYWQFADSDDSDG